MEKLLMARLEWLRAHLYEVAKKEGIGTQRVLEISREIDVLHNRLNNLKKERYREKREASKQFLREQFQQYRFSQPINF